MRVARRGPVSRGCAVRTGFFARGVTTAGGPFSLDLQGAAVSGLGEKPTIPLLPPFVVVGFLLLQNQVDRRDPELASAPVGAEPELDLGPELGTRSCGPLAGGAPA